MWINPKTDKGWTDLEEYAFAMIQSVSRLPRIKAIHLWKRCKKDLKRALKIALRDYPPLTKAQKDSLVKASAARHRV